MLRRVAFRWSESNWFHWFILLGADRINVIEGVLSDLRHGQIPNIPVEMGMRSERRFNKGGLIRKLLLIAVVLSGVVALAFWIW
jgi:hypothetical protein